MPPALRKALDIFTAIGLTAAAFFVIVVANSFLMARGGGQGLKLWYSFIVQPDILGTIVLTACITMAYVFWKQSGRPRM